MDLWKKEQLNKDFVKINPQHTVPTLNDNGFILWESRAIAIYLADRNHPDVHPLYPKEVHQRAVIDQRLYFDCGTLQPRLKDICVSHSMESFLCKKFTFCFVCISVSLDLFG